MELVSGVAITEYCDQNRLTPRERLELFISVCQAIQHAHQKGIIHRDVKPTNVLVTTHDGRPVVKVIDFGVAKALGQQLTERTVYTQFAQMIGTPLYMSPEQAAMGGLDVDTRSDIYSLGVMLYELLAGSTPYERKWLQHAAFDEMLRVIREEDPPKPSTRLSSSESLPTIAASRRLEPHKLTTLVRGELDWIVMKALEKDRARRYESAGGLARDIERYLNDEPVLACPPSALYRLRKTVRRNRVAFTAATAVLAALMIGLGLSTWLFFQEREARQRAVAAEHEQSRHLKDAEAARRSEAELRKQAEQSEAQATTNLWGAYLAQARANRMTERAGRRFASLEALRKAAEIRPSIELRNEVIACLAFPDLRLAKEWEGDPKGTTMIGFDQDFERYARSDPQGNISVRRVSDDVELMKLPGFGSVCEWILRFSPDGKYLAAVYQDARICHVWDLHRRQVIWKTPSPVFQAAFDISLDSQFLAACDPMGTISIHELVSGRKVRKLENDIVPSPHTMRYSRDGRQLAISTLDDPRVQIRDVSSDVVRVTFPHPTGVRGIAWHPNGKLLATACGDGQIRVWDIDAANLVAVFRGHQSVADHVEYSNDGRLLASTGWDDSFRLWDVSGEQQLIYQFDGHRQLRFTPDGKYLGIVRNGTNLGYYELATCDEVRSYDGRTGVIAAADVSHDGQLLAIACDDGVRIWDLVAGTEVIDFPLAERVFSVVFHPDGRSLFTSSYSGVFRWPMKYDPGTPNAELQLSQPENLAQLNNSEHAILSPDGERLFVTVPHGPVNAYSVNWRDNGGLVKFHGHPFSAGISLSSDGRLLATSTWSGNAEGIGVKVWDAETGAVVTELPVDGNSSVLFSCSGKWLVTGSPVEYRFWEVGSWKPRHAIVRNGAAEMMGYMACSPDGKILALSRSRQGVQLVDPETGRELATFAEDDQSPLCFSHDGNYLVTGGITGRVHVWNVASVRQRLAEMNLDWE
jgi:WD40 repeat protein